MSDEPTGASSNDRVQGDLFLSHVVTHRGVLYMGGQEGLEAMTNRAVFGGLMAPGVRAEVPG